jgi:hypothetical protein
MPSALGAGTFHQIMDFGYNLPVQQLLGDSRIVEGAAACHFMSCGPG